MFRTWVVGIAVVLSAGAVRGGGGPPKEKSWKEWVARLQAEDAEDLEAEPSTVGKVVRGSIVKLLDENGKEVPGGESGRIFSQRYTSGRAFHNIAMRSAGYAVIVNTAGRLKIRCAAPSLRRLFTRSSFGHGSASACARTRARIAGSRAIAAPPP